VQAGAARCGWCDSIASVTAAQNAAFPAHHQTLADQAARTRHTYRGTGDVNPAWIAGVVIAVMLVVIRACRYM
jgi:hypothetical protein